ncbi:8074_t:CDS:2 [Funneliformis geosporum]|nr:8074_t:CDS:2 [Funneliformis geosporum]
MIMDNGIDPGKFHTITVKVAQIWKDMKHNIIKDHVKIYLNMKIHEKKDINDQKNNYKSDTPTVWWKTSQNSKDEWELQSLTL